MSLRIQRTNRNILLLSGIILAVAVAMGAFGAHGLEASLSEKAMKTYQTGAKYHFYHGLGLILVTIVSELTSIKFNGAIISFLIGILVFSGNCYLYAITGVKFFAMIVPIGGVAFILGWLLFAFKMIRSEE